MSKTNEADTSAKAALEKSDAVAVAADTVAVAKDAPDPLGGVHEAIAKLGGLSVDVSAAADAVANAAVTVADIIENAKAMLNDLKALRESPVASIEAAVHDGGKVAKDVAELPLGAAFKATMGGLEKLLAGLRTGNSKPTHTVNQAMAQLVSAVAAHPDLN